MEFQNFHKVKNSHEFHMQPSNNFINFRLSSLSISLSCSVGRKQGHQLAGLHVTPIHSISWGTCSSYSRHMYTPHTRHAVDRQIITHLYFYIYIKRHSVLPGVVPLSQSHTKLMNCTSIVLNNNSECSCSTPM